MYYTAFYLQKKIPFLNLDNVISEYVTITCATYKNAHYDFNIVDVIGLLFEMNRDSKTWSTGGIEGVHRFLGRTWRLIVGPPLPDGSYRDGTVATDSEPTLEQLRVLHRCIAKVS